MIELEKRIIERLGGLGDVDGHDVGSGEMNIFIVTDHPREAFDRIKGAIERRQDTANLKLAFREIGKDVFTILHPEGLTRFKIS